MSRTATLGATKPDKRPKKDKEGFQKVVRKQYVVKQKLPIPEAEAPSSEKPIGPNNNTPYPRSRSPSNIHDGVSTPNPFAALDLVSTVEEDPTLILPIKAMGAYPIDHDEYHPHLECEETKQGLQTNRSGEVHIHPQH